MPAHHSEVFLKDKHESPELIQRVITRKPLSNEEFFRLAKYSNYTVNRMLGCNPACPEELLKQFSESSGSHGWYVRRGVAENPRIPSDLMAKLAFDPNAYVRTSLAANPSLSKEIRQALFAGNDVSAHCGLAMNPTTPPEMLRTIYHQYENALIHKRRVTGMDFAMNPKLPNDLAEKIYQQEKDKSYSLELDCLAMNPSVSPELLLNICRNSKSARPLRTLQCQQNPNCPEELKKEMLLRE